MTKKVVDELVSRQLVYNDGEEIGLTDEGLETTRRVIRSHRIAERLVHDVLGVPFEQGACEFEHIVNQDLVDSICTLLGHPRECPHGMPIPEGECCREQVQTVETTVVPLTKLKLGENARVAYVYADDDRQMHKLDNLLIRPGIDIKLHQRVPSVVIECENSMIAIDDHVAANIFVWATSSQETELKPRGRRGFHRGLRHGGPRKQTRR